MNDPVHHPSHYNTSRFGIECIELTRHMDFCGGNAVKYLFRHEDKGKPLEDLRKAAQYLEWCVEDGEFQSTTAVELAADKLSAQIAAMPRIYSAIPLIVNGIYAFALEVVRDEIAHLEATAAGNGFTIPAEMLTPPTPDPVARLATAREKAYARQVMDTQRRMLTATAEEDQP